MAETPRTMHVNIHIDDKLQLQEALVATIIERDDALAALASLQTITDEQVELLEILDSNADVFVNTIQTVTAERDAALTALGTAVLERDSAIAERKYSFENVLKIAEQRDKAIAERAELRNTLAQAEACIAEHEKAIDISRTQTKDALERFNDLQNKQFDTDVQNALDIINVASEDRSGFVVKTPKKSAASAWTNILVSDETKAIMMGFHTIQTLQTAIHETAKEHGWWEPQEQTVKVMDDRFGDAPYQALVQRSFGDLVALMHSELSEALEAFRERGLEKWYVTPNGGITYDLGCSAKEAGKTPNDFNWKPEGSFVELADCIIRILDCAGFYGIDMQALIVEKMKYNETRPYRHGNKNL